MALYTPRPLEAAWEAILTNAAPRTTTSSALAVMVERVSRRYNGEEVVIARSDELLARTLFWFARDIQKPGLAIAELARAGALPSRPLSVLDVGAGMGATSLGLLRALADPEIAARTPVRIERIDALDRDGEALAIFGRIAESALRAGLIAEGTAVRSFTGDLLAAASDATSGLPSVRRPYDLVVAGSVLVEVTRAAGDEIARGAAIADRIHQLVDAAPLAPDGAMIVIEPATRADTRPLHHARAALLERGYGIFAPCTHSEACPMLERDRDWCHEDLAANLPPWLVPIAREAGLRWEGLTFSYLVVRRDRTHSVRDIVAREAGADLVPVRIVSQPRSTKGKTEAFASGPFEGPTRGPRLMQLDRDVKRAADDEDGGRLAELVRGDLVGLDRAAAARSTEGKAVRVTPAEVRPVRPPSEPTPE